VSLLYIEYNEISFVFISLHRAYVSVVCLYVIQLRVCIVNVYM